MPIIPLEDYLAQQQQKQGTEFINRMKTQGIDPEQFRQPNGHLVIPLLKASAPPPPTNDQQPGVTSSAFQRGVLGVGEDLSAFAGMASQAVGAQGASDFFFGKAQQYAAKEQTLPSTIPDFQSIKDGGDLATYIWERTVENVPMLASLLIPGAGATKAAKLIGAGAKMASRLGWTSAFLTDVGLQTGESAVAVKQSNKDPVDIRVVGTGLGKAALDFLPLFAVAKSIGLGSVLEKSFIAELTKGGYIRRVAGDALILQATEVPTEVAQQALDIALQRAVNDKGGDLTDDEWSQLKNAAAGAAAVGLGLAPLAGLGRPNVATVHDTNPPELNFKVPGPPPPFGGLITGPIVSTASGPIGAGNFTVTPSGDVYRPGQKPPERVFSSADNSAFDYATIYDKETGSLKVLGNEWRKTLQEQNAAIAYDPSQERMVISAPGPSWRSVNPSWVAGGDGTFTLADDAKITQTAQGFVVEGANGTSLGVFPDQASAMKRGEEYAWQRSPIITIGTDGDLRVSQALSPERIAAETAKRTQNPTANDIAMVALDEAQTAAARRPDDYQVLPTDREAVAAAQVDPGMQRLLELRAETLADKDLYRKDNGDLSASGAKKVAGIEARIAKLSTLLGIPDPLQTQQEHSVVAQPTVEARLSAIAQAAERAQSRPTYRNLSLAEGKLFDRLQEKEQIEGLTDNEWQQLEKLQTTIKEGSDKPFKRKLTKADLKELEDELNRVDRMEQRYQAVAAEEAARTANEAAGATAEVSDTGEYLYSRKPTDYQPVTSRMDAERRWSAGEAIFAAHEQDGTPHRVKSFDELQNYAPDQLYYSPPRASKVVGLPKFEVRPSADPTIAQVFVDNKHVGVIIQDSDGQFYGGLIREAQPRVRDAAKEALWQADRGYIPGEPFEYYYPLGKDSEPSGVLFLDESPKGTTYRAAVLDGTEPRELGQFATEEAAKIAVENAHTVGVEGMDQFGPFATAQEAARALRREALPLTLRKSAAEIRAENKSIELKDAVAAVAPIVSALQIKPKLRFVRLAELSPEELKHADGAMGLFSLKRVGEVTLVLDNLFSKRQAQMTFVHETLAHFGLRAFFSPEELTGILREVLVARRKEIENYELGRGNTDPVLTLRDAEEFIARKTEAAWVRWTQGERDWEREPDYEKPSDRTFVGKIIAFFKRVLRSFGLSLGKDMWTDPQIARMMKDVAMFLSGKITGRNPAGMMGHFTTEPMKRVVGKANLSQAVPNMNSFAEVWGAKFATFFMTPLQLAEKYNIPGAAKYLEAVQLWWARKRDLTTDATNTALEWQQLPKRDQNRLAQALFEINSRSDELGRRLTDEEVATTLKEFDLGKDAQNIYSRVDESFKTVLNQLQAGLEFSALREHTRDKAQAEALHKLWREGNYDEFYARSKEVLGNLEVSGRLTQIEKEMNQLRERNYFPHMRFGPYGLYVRAKEELSFRGRTYQPGQVVYFETFETFKARDQGTSAMLGEFPPRLYDLGYGKVSDEEFAFLGMPPSLYDALKDRLDLNQGQLERLKELYFSRSPGRAFLRHLTKRRGVEGFSADALRVYSTYMMNAANHIARVEYHGDMGNELNTMRAAGKEMGDVAGILRDYFAKHYNYIMNPENDLAQLRSLGFLWYLGFNVKSAAVNLTQVPMVAYPYLASVHGDGKATAALAKAYGTVVRIMRGHSVLDDAAQLDLNRALREGVIDESQASELAGLAEAPVLQRLMPTSVHGRLLNNVSYYGGWLFRYAEIFNRRVVFVAARELALQSGLKGEDAYLAARKAVQTTMFEYAKWNRPTYSQGKKSAFFLFWNYMQHLSFLSFGGQGKGTAIRIWTLLLLAAGLQGLPFAENILDLLDLGSTKAKELLGSNDPHVDLRTDLRALAQQLTDNPDMIMHGLSRHYGLGPLHLLQLLGVPVPGTDTSGSLSAGRVIPGTDQLTRIDSDPDKRFGQAIVDSLGPVAGIGYNMWRVLTSQDPDQWKVWERAMPNAIKSASQAVRRWDRGAETFRGGGSVATFDPHDGTQRAELIANSLGFQPSRVSERYELRGLQEDLKQYWTTRRAMVLENFAYAFLSKDPEAMADAREAIRRFNAQAPAPQLRVKPDSLERSIKGTLHRSSLREEGLPNERAFEPLYRSVSRLFPGVELSGLRSQTSAPPPPQ